MEPSPTIARPRSRTHTLASQGSGTTEASTPALSRRTERVFSVGSPRAGLAAIGGCISRRLAALYWASGPPYASDRGTRVGEGRRPQAGPHLTFASVPLLSGRKRAARRPQVRRLPSDLASARSYADRADAGSSRPRLAGPDPL